MYVGLPTPTTVCLSVFSHVTDVTKGMVSKLESAKVRSFTGTVADPLLSMVKDQTYALSKFGTLPQEVC